MNGKGDTRRPCFVDDETLGSNWERTFHRALSDHMDGIMQAAANGEACTCEYQLHSMRRSPDCPRHGDG
jgi:hypothetical protein